MKPKNDDALKPPPLPAPPVPTPKPNVETGTKLFQESRLAAKESSLDNVEPKLSNMQPPSVPASVSSAHTLPKPKETVTTTPVPPPVAKQSTEAGHIEAALKQTMPQTPLDKNKMQQLEIRCQELEKQLLYAETHILELQRNAAQRMDEEEEWRQSHLRHFQEEQARTVEAAIEAATEEHKRELAEMRDLLQQECLALKDQLQQEQTQSQQEIVQFRRLLEEAEVRTKAAETEKRLAVSKLKSSSSQLQQQQERSVRMAEEKLAHTMATLDERNEEISKLKAAIKELKVTTTEHRKGAEEAEKEMDELHSENEMLRRNLLSALGEREELTKQLKFFESQKEKMSGLQVRVFLDCRMAGDK
jgi:chromosome segregation ATPase